MIGGLQGAFVDLVIKYLKQNISKCRSHISGSFRRTPRHYAKWLRNSPSKRFQKIRICLTGEVETPSSPIRRQAPDAKYPEKVCVGCETSRWNVGRAEFWMCCPNHWLKCTSLATSFRQPATYPDLLMAKDFKALVLHVSELSIDLPWIPKNSPQSHIGLVIKNLSKHQNLTQFDQN